MTQRRENRSKSVREIPDDLWNDLKAEAAKRGMKVYGAIREAIADWVKAQRREPK